MDKATVESVMALLNPCCVTFAKWKELGKRGRTAEEEDAALREMRDAQEAFRAEVERLAAQSAPSEPSSDLPTYTDDLELRYVEACEERDHLRAVLRAQSAQAPAQAVQEAPAVRMLTEDEVAELVNSSRYHDRVAFTKIMQRKFCAVNAGRTIPASGEIGGV